MQFEHPAPRPRLRKETDRLGLGSRMGASWKRRVVRESSATGCSCWFVRGFIRRLIAVFSDMADSNSDLTLFVKASTINDSDFGADVFAQRFMMMLVLKDIAVDISLVDAVKSRQMKKLPALQFLQNDLLEDPAEIETLIEKISPDHPLRIENEEVNHLVFKGPGSGVYHKFCQLTKNADSSTDERLKGVLKEELKALDDFLISERMPGKFLGGENLCLPDCILLPKLLHIKVVAKAFKDFEIPEEFVGIHKYMDAANENQAFTRTSPSEEVIVDAWARAMKVPNPLQRKARKH